MPKRTDLLVQGEGSIYLLRAASRRGQRWVDEHVSDERQEWCGAVVVEHRYIRDIVHGAVSDGLLVRRHFGGAHGARPSSTFECADIAGADDALVPREIESGNPDRWAEYNRKFNAVLRRA